jgi:anaerobic magnesium-protoporphyrin IX monomethyl ester cyclase
VARRVLFVQDTPCEYAGVATLSAVLRRDGHETDLLVVDGEPRGLARLRHHLRRTRPDLVGFTATTVSVGRLLKAATVVKRAGIPTIFGGFHPTFFPELAEHPDVDWICRGEGEGALLDLVRLLGDDLPRAREIPNLAWADAEGLHCNPLRPLVDVNSLPTVDRELYFDRFAGVARFSNKRVFVGRGCPHGCTFCYNAQLRRLFDGLGPFVRMRDPRSIIDEVLDIRVRYGFETLTFTCESFTTDRAWALDFLERYGREVGAPFMTAAVFSDLDEELIEALAGAGCFCLSVGLETGNDRIRRKVLGKGFDKALAARVGDLCRNHGIDLMAFCMFGLPDEGLAEAWETVDVLGAIGARTISPTLLQPYPGTPIHRSIVRRGLLRAGVTEEDIFNKPIGSVIDSPDRRAIENVQKLAWLALKVPASRPALERLVHLPPNPLFSTAMMVGLLHKYTRSRRVGTLEFLRLARHMRRDFRSFFW